MSERDLVAANAAAVQAEVVRPALFLEGEFASGWGRWWTGYGTIAWGGHDWTGLGTLVGISELSEATGVQAQGFSVSLAGQDPATLALALSACRQNAVGRIYLGFFDAAGALLADPHLLHGGMLDVPEGTDAGETATITVRYEDELIDLERAREYRYTPESQKLFYPDDKGFDFVASLQDAVDVW